MSYIAKENTNAMRDLGSGGVGVKYIRWGVYEVGNGYDYVICTYSRGTKDDAGQYAPHWTIVDKAGGEELACVYGDKDSALAKARTIVSAPGKLPLDDDTMAKQAARDGGFVHGIVNVTLSELLRLEVDAFLDVLTARLLAEDMCLEDVTYTIVGFTADSVNIRVCGKPAAMY